MSDNTNTDDQYMVTTTDNPYNPFTQYDEWMAYDEALGYYTPGLLARYTSTSDDLSDVDQELAIKQGIDELLADNPLGVHRKVNESFYSKSS